MDLWVMGACLHHIEAMVHNQSFSTDFISVFSKEKWYKENPTHQRIPPDLMVEITTLYNIFVIACS